MGSTSPSSDTDAIILLNWLILSFKEMYACKRRKVKKRIEKKYEMEGVRWVGGVGSGSSGDQKGVVSP